MKANILLVDDDPVNLDVLSRRLDREGYLVNRSKSGSGALASLEVQQFDLVILDAHMPDMDGLEVLKRIKANPVTKSTPVIMLSTKSSQRMTRQCLLAGAADHLTKPLIMELARRRIEINLRNQGISIPATAQNQQFLVVDDEPLNLRLLETMVSKMGYTTVTAENGSEALLKIKDGAIDLVLLDIIMPDISGIEVLADIRKTYSAIQLPVIMVTAEDGHTAMVEAVTAGANDYITKPYDAFFLRKRIDAVLASQRYLLNPRLI